MHRLAALLAALLLALVGAPVAGALEPPAIDPAAIPPDETGPDQPTELRRACAAPAVFPESNFADKPWANDYLRLAEAQKFATGAGVTVAVIDTGVNGSPRVPAEPGGDFVDQAGNGMSDCDAHGTLTASIVAGRPAPTDGFIGVAPDARILSLRQTSAAFQPVGARTDPNDPNSTQTAGSLRSLARAVVHAANLGAQVINISEAACYKVTRPIDEASLGAAINYAVNVKNAVVIVAAGNTGQDCTQNPPPDPALPADPRGWEQVQTVVSPAWYSPLVLTVGGIAENGQPSSFSMSGPWLGAAAPAENLTALGYDGNPVNALHGEDGLIPISGTSFAAAYVSGLAALLKQRFPELTPAQIINRITATARHPGGGVDNYVGAGVIDPVAALTWDVPAGPERAPYQVKEIPPPVHVPPPDRGPITAVVIAAAALALAIGLGILARRALRRR
ncbi:type VII secretion-associated serine protease mycosin [Mycolicibacterium elephantis]|uniref:type VII secretion-associated serine protease mycosin n=1 Tax=Mycolicibacterium elephantis TaxID=81858 RepID=UPI0007EA6A05|nr:type VII secretion-associated serine protease mycosin [Mycolicibacterium elephantis]OBA74075.1 type VII secretion-associated serine protease mycosin [Mycolicibacterium elephantis]OBE95215.1 type VII secretion-associated serine protease mycosin [Mycolicibacterium elephantis]